MAEGLNASSFATWSENTQHAFIQNGVVMASTMASRANPDYAQCIADWYFADGEVLAGRNETIVSSILNYPDYAPTSVIVGVIEQQCGKLTVSTQ